MKLLLFLVLCLIVICSIVLVIEKRKKKISAGEAKPDFKPTYYSPMETLEILEGRSASDVEFLDNQQKAENFMQSRNLKPAANCTKFFSVCLNGAYKYRWLSRTENGIYYTFDVKGKELKKHSRQPNFYDICPLKDICLYHRYYNVFSDTQIMPA